MSRKGLFTGTRVVAVLISVPAMGVLASPALAISAGDGQVVTGTSLPSISLTAGAPALFATNFSPGGTANATSLLTATTTDPTWSLSVKDNGTGQGKMVANTLLPTCTGSDAQLGNPLQVTVNDLGLTGVTSDGQVSISSADTPVAASGVSGQLLSAEALTTSYHQVIPAAEVMLSGCVYSLTATYTLQGS